MSISKDLKDKIELLRKWDQAYYSNDESLVSDEKYDLLKDYVFRNLPPDSPELKELLKKVGHTPSSGWKKETHDIQMGSQNKVSTVNAIKEWWESTLRKLGVTEAKAVLQHKRDGFSFELKYQQGRLVSGVTRGDGSIGENITQNAVRFRDVPKVLPIAVDVVVRGEGQITKADFETLNAAAGGRYKNARNLASGIARRYSGEDSEYIHVTAYDISGKAKTETQKIEVLKKLGFATVESHPCSDLAEILRIYQDYKDTLRDLLEFEIDGLVLKLDDVELQEQLGILNNRPQGQIALKFSSDQAITTLQRIQEQVGRTGKVTPVGLLEGVELMGSTVTKATLHNFAYIAANFISPGAEVVIEKKGDIIPQVVDIVTAGEGYERPTQCPSCGGKLEWDDVNLWCRNDGCKGRETARIAYWMKTLDMKGFSDSFVEKLWDTGKVRNVGDLYKLTADDLSMIGGLGAKTAKGFLKALKDTSEMYLEQFIVALGIPTVSKGTAALLVEQFRNWDTIIDMTREDLQKMPGFAKVSADNTFRGIREIAGMADELLQVITIKEKKKGTLTGLSFCVTGSLSGLSRKEFETFVVEHGGVFKGSVSAGLDYLVTNTPDSGSGKNGKAIKVNEKLVADGAPEKQIKIITEKEFLELAGDEPMKPKSEEKEQKDGPDLDFEPLPLF